MEGFLGFIFGIVVGCFVMMYVKLGHIQIANAYLAPCLSQGFTYNHCYNEAMSILKPEGE